MGARCALRANINSLLVQLVQTHARSQRLRAHHTSARNRTMLASGGASYARSLARWARTKTRTRTTIILRCAGHGPAESAASFACECVSFVRLSETRRAQTDSQTVRRTDRRTKPKVARFALPVRHDTRTARTAPRRRFACDSRRRSLGACARRAYASAPAPPADNNSHRARAHNGR